MSKTYRKDSKNERWRKEKQRRNEKRQHSKHSAFEGRANFYIDKKESYGDQEAWRDSITC